MLLHSFSIKNYRSIFEINDLEFSNTLTTFIGKNNQGKSNILKAFDLIFKVIKFYSEEELAKRIELDKEAVTEGKFREFA